MEQKLFNKRGQVMGVVMQIFVGFGVLIVIGIFVTSIAGQTYQQVEADIDSISNTTIKGYVKSSVANSFESYATITGYQDLIGLGLIMVLILSLLLPLTGMVGGRGGGAGGL